MNSLKGLETLPFHEEPYLGDALEEIIREVYDNYCSGDTSSTREALRQVAREAFWQGRVFEREYGMRTVEVKS